MATREAAEYIPRSLAEGESADDFETLLDALTAMRVRFHPELDYRAVEAVSGKIVCLLTVAKPPRYQVAMQTFRRLFQGVSASGELRSVFVNSVLPAALMLTDDDIWFRPSLYFTLRPIREHRPSDEERPYVRAWY